MTFALSTNWCNRRLTTGEAIVDEALALGFEALELGFHTTDEQVKGFKARRDEMPIGSVHAFCPVPLSAPQGYPELYQLASMDAEMRKMAVLMVKKNIRFTSEMGASTLVVHMGRVMRGDLRGRVKAGRKMIDIAKLTIEKLLPDLETYDVTLALENLPYLQGFPAEWELAALCGQRVRPWFDTGHDFVRVKNGWKTFPIVDPIGLHINDSVGGDDHLAPGAGFVDFKGLKPLAVKARHVVFEPHADVPFAELKKGLDYLKDLWL